MESEKLEDLLLLSLSASKGQRERSEVLDVGVTRDKNLREVIVKYSGDIDELQIPGMEIQKLLAGYAIVKLPEDQIGALVAAREIEYVEMPKNLQTGLYEAKRVSCILPLLSQRDEGASLDGKGVLIAVLDSGIDCRIFERKMAAAGFWLCGIRNWNRSFHRNRLTRHCRQKAGTGRWSLCRASTAPDMERRWRRLLPGAIQISG